MAVIVGKETTVKKKLYRSTFTYEGKKYERTSAKSQREADRKADKLLKEIQEGLVGISGKMRVKDWAHEWLETYKKPVVAPKQYEDHVSQVNKTIVSAIGNMRLKDVKDIHLQKILNSKTGYSYSYLKKLRQRIQAMFRQAKKSRLIIFDPAESLIMPAAENGTHRSITDFEREHFLKAAATHHAGLMFKTMLFCGLRTGEAVALDWRDIDFDRRRIKVTRAMESGTKNIKAPKTKAGIREVPIPDELFDDLLAAKGNPCDSVFVSERAKTRHTHGTRKRAWDSLKRQIDISMGAVFEKRMAKDSKMRMTKVLSLVADDFVPYCLRHTYCTDLQNAGVPINVAKYLMGHSDITMTASIYTHITDKAIDGAARLINGGFTGVTDSVTSVVESKKTA